MSAVDFIKRNITKEKIEDLLGNHGAKNIRVLGDCIRCTCPIHNGDNDTAFVWNLEKNLWICHTECGGGDIFTFISLIYELDNFKEAVCITANELGLDIIGMEILEATNDYKKETEQWLKYMLKRNVIFNAPYDLSKLGLRYPLKEYRRLDGDLLREYGIGYLKDMNKYVFPIFDINNNIIGASLRAVGNEKPKWIHRPKSIKTGDILYNISKCISNGYREVYIVEGMIDCLRLISFGIQNVVCTFGARITDEQKMLLIKYFDKIILGFDNDEAGKTATKKSIEKLHKIIEISVLKINDRHDLGDVESLEEFNNIERVEWYKWNLKD